LTPRKKSHRIRRRIIPIADMVDLDSQKLRFLEQFVSALSGIPGIAAIALGGSYARGTARPDSDMDIGLYYSERAKPDVETIRRCIERFSVPERIPTVTDFYKWGPWVNGGAWIHTLTGKVDVLYRNIEQVQRVVDESQAGIYHHDFYQQPAFGFTSVIYLAEMKWCLPLFEKREILSAFKRKVGIYPPRLRERLIENSLWTAEFAFAHANGFAERGDIFNAVGCLARIAFLLVQSLFAINAEYYFGDKGAMEALDRFARQPDKFCRRLQDVLACPKTSPKELEPAVHQMRSLWREVVDLTEGRYNAKFDLSIIPVVSPNGWPGYRS
jgi:predicted nucleotidyltransferase